jgi:hypothetical protein
MSTTIDGSASVTINSGAVLGITSGTAVASTSGTSIDFTSIPSWVKRITVMFNGVSTNGTSLPLIQIGSGSVESTGYNSVSTSVINAGASGGTTSTAGFIINAANASHVFYGSFVIANVSGNIWVLSGLVTTSASGTIVSIQTAGSKTTSGTLDRVRITTVNGTDTFDAGSINIFYE